MEPTATTTPIEVKDATSLRIEVARQDIHLYELAERIGGGVPYLSDVMHGKVKPTERYFLRISAGLTAAQQEADAKRRAEAEQTATPNIRKL